MAFSQDFIANAEQGLEVTFIHCGGPLHTLGYTRDLKTKVNVSAAAVACCSRSALFVRAVKCHCNLSKLKKAYKMVLKLLKKAGFETCQLHCTGTS